MILSNPRIFFPLFVIIAINCQACSSANQTQSGAIPSIAEIPGDFPFSTKEPEIYQGDFVVSDGQNEDTWFVARNGEKRRLDYHDHGQLVRSEIVSDRLYLIDHLARTFTPKDTNRELSSAFSGIGRDFFRGYEHREFDEIENLDGLVKYRIRSDAPGNETVLTFDTAKGMITRQEFRSADGGTSFIYEVKNLRLAVDDSVFQIPNGYKEVPAKELEKK